MTDMLAAQMASQGGGLPPVSTIIGMFAKDDPLLVHPIDSALLSIRVRNVFREEGIETIGDLSAYSDDRLLRFQNFDGKCLYELKLMLTDRISVFGMPACFEHESSPSCVGDAALSEDAGLPLSLVVAGDVASGPSSTMDAGRRFGIIDPGNTVADEIHSIAVVIMSRGKRANDASVRHNVGVIRAYYGLDGKAKTLQEIASPRGMTRERVRQLLNRIPAFVSQLHYAPGKRSHLAKLQGAIRFPAESGGNYGARFEDLLGPVLTLRDAVRFFDDAFGIGPRASVNAILDDSAGSRRRLVELARALIGLMGAVSVGILLGLAPARLGIPITEENIVSALRSDPRFLPLESGDGWYWLGPDQSGSMFLREIEKMLVCAQRRLDLYDMMAAIWRLRSVRRPSRMDDFEVAPLPIRVAKEVLGFMPWARAIQTNDFIYVGAQAEADVLPPPELAMVRSIRALGGVASRAQIVAMASSSFGQIGATVSAGLGSSSVVCRLDHGIYVVIGTRLSEIVDKLPALLEIKKAKSAR